MDREKLLLIVDDEQGIRGIFEEIFEGDCNVICVSRGDEALKTFLERRPDAVILDFELEGILRGDHVLKLMKLANTKVFIVMMTARGELKEKLLQEGADAFYEKPFNALVIRDHLFEMKIIGNGK